MSQNNEQAPNFGEDNAANNLQSDHEDFNNNQDSNNNNNNNNNFNKNKLLNSQISFQNGATGSHYLQTEKKQPLNLRDMYDSRSPERTQSQVEDLTRTLQITYENELEKHRFFRENSEKRYAQLLNDKQKLEQQLSFWRNKASEASVAKESDKQYNESVSNEQLIVIEEAQNLQIKFLELEKEKLEQALRERSAEADEWQNKATEFEERFLTSNRIQFELQSYERRIQKAIDDNADKAKEFEDNQLVLAQLELKNADILKLEEELNTIKEMVDFRTKEGIELKASVDALTIEDLNGKNLHARLLENERRLVAQIDLLKAQLASLLTQKENELKNNQIKNEAILSQLKAKFENEKQNLNVHKRVLESNINHRNDDINNFRLHNTALDKELRDVIRVERQLEIEAEHNRIRHDSAELEKRRAIEMETHLKNATIDRLNREQNLHRNIMNDKISNLSKNLLHKSVDLTQTREQLTSAEREKLHRELEQQALQKRLNDAQVTLSLNEAAHDRDLRLKAAAQNAHLNQVQNVHRNVESSLINHTNNLSTVFDVNRRNAEIAQGRANHFQQRLIETEIKERQTSAEAELARRKAAEIEAAKNLELQLSVERKRREIDNLSRSQSFEKEIAIKKKVDILNLINHKDRDNAHLHYQNLRTINEYHSNSAEKIAAQNAANYYKNRTNLNVHQTINDSIVQDNITRNSLNTINVIRNNEKNLIQRDIHVLNTSAVINQSHANVQRANIHNLVNSTYSRYPGVVYY